MSNVNSNTLKNVTRLYINKCQDFVKYRMMSDTCFKNGYGLMGRYFKDFSKQEYNRARILSSIINELNSSNEYIITEISLKNLVNDNINEIIDSELYQKQNNGYTRYKTFAKIAFDEGYKSISQILDLLAEAEQNHIAMLEDFKSRLTSIKEQCFCINCGLKLDKNDKICPLCLSKRDIYEIKTK